MELGKTIKKLREARGWSQDELAFRTGTSAANLSRIENGKHGAGEALLEALAKEFGYRIYELVALAEGVESPVIPSVTNADEEKLIAQFRAMTEQQRLALISIASELVKK
jgi:transcriptional regulator with XRE-family HTH domain